MIFQLMMWKSKNWCERYTSSSEVFNEKKKKNNINGIYANQICICCSVKFWRTISLRKYKMYTSN